MGFSCKVMGHDFTQYDFEDGVGNLGGYGRAVRDIRGYSKKGEGC